MNDTATSASADATVARILQFYCPFTAESNPEGSEILRATTDWAARYDLGAGDLGKTEMLAQTGVAYTVCATPHARGALAQALSDYNAWAWAINDFVGSATGTAATVYRLGRWERITRSPGSWRGEGDLFEAAGSEVLDRIRGLVTPVQWQRFAAGQSQWIQAMAWEVAIRELARPLGVNEYVAMRISCVGVYAATSYFDMTEAIELSEAQWSDPLVRAAVEAGAFAGGLDNDRYSYLREKDLAITKNSIFTAIATDHPDLTAYEVVDRAIGLRDACLTQYLHLRDRALNAAGDELQQYLRAVDLMIGGNLNFAVMGIRYHHPAVAGALTITADPPHTTVARPHIPTIEWWWAL
ncbi:terpene synthase family protein [Mycobacteroides abscessus]|uniref:terpene synthase family protein n=1 Tax=Mycobacteroides abscessus TaxID=36809 RepID=UPI0012AB2DA5|nr:hypothetical protein [Mycobacteroides abscessus]